MKNSCSGNTHISSESNWIPVASILTNWRSFPGHSLRRNSYCCAPQAYSRVPVTATLLVVQ